MTAHENRRRFLEVPIQGPLPQELNYIFSLTGVLWTRSPGCAAAAGADRSSVEKGAFSFFLLRNAPFAYTTTAWRQWPTAPTRSAGAGDASRRARASGGCGRGRPPRCTGLVHAGRDQAPGVRRGTGEANDI